MEMETTDANITGHDADGLPGVSILKPAAILWNGEVMCNVVKGQPRPSWLIPKHLKLCRNHYGYCWSWGWKARLRDTLDWKSGCTFKHGFETRSDGWLAAELRAMLKRGPISVEAAEDAKWCVTLMRSITVNGTISQSWIPDDAARQGTVVGWGQFFFFCTCSLRSCKLHGQYGWWQQHVAARDVAMIARVNGAQDVGQLKTNTTHFIRKCTTS